MAYTFFDQEIYEARRRRKETRNALLALGLLILIGGLGIYIWTILGNNPCPTPNC